MRSPDRISEDRLDSLRQEASRFDAGTASARPDGRGDDKLRGYSGRPVLKPPVWTWEVPLYFFFGGAGGAASAIALAALATNASAPLSRVALGLAAACGAVSPPLLISDLGRPRRALNMFRVFKRQSPMSVGSWALFMFGTTSAAAFLGHELGLRGLGGSVLQALTFVAATVAALSGLVVATYTGVLLGATVLPVWNERHRILPIQAGVTALGTAAAALFLLVPASAVPWRLLVLAGIAELLLAGALELDRRPSGRPLHSGPSGLKLRLGGLLCGPVTLVTALFVPVVEPWADGGFHVGPMQAVTGLAFLAGALLLRIGWIQAGRASAADPAVTLDRRDEA